MIASVEKSAPKHTEISRQLRAEIASGKFGTAGRLPSEAQLVARFGVSRPTVGQALRTLETEGLVERRVGSGTYVKSSGGARSAGAMVLALLFPDLGNTEIFQLIGGEIASLARVHDFTLAWGGSAHPRLDPDLNLEHAKELCRQYIERRVSGVFFVPYELVPEKEAANRRMAEMLREAGIPVVLLDRDLTLFPLRSDFDVIGVDNFAGGFLLAEHLLKLGSRRLNFVARPGSAPTVDARIAGVREALARRGSEPAAGWVRIGEMNDKAFVRNLTTAPLPDAFLCANDHTAALLLRALHDARVRVPEKVRVVGFDDVKFATLVSPPLTTAQQPCREIALTAFRAMLDRQADPTLPARHISLPPRLVVRDSCGAYLSRR
jgi:LacI family transcriptional regulator